MVGMAFVVGIVDTFHRFAVYADCPAGMHYRTFERVHALPPLGKALAAGSLTVAGFLSAHADVPFAAQMLFIIAAVFHGTF